MKPHIRRSLLSDNWAVYVNGFREFQHPSYLACCCYCHLTSLGVRVINAGIRPRVANA